LIAKPSDPSLSVPCNGCRMCCINDLIIIDRTLGDDPDNYITEQTSNNLLRLSHKPNGECVHLGPRGCMVHDNPPYKCRTFDCRIMALMMKKHPDKEKMISRGLLDKRILQRGKDLLQRYPIPQHIKEWKKKRSTTHS